MTLYLQAALSLSTILLRNFCERSLLYYVLQNNSFSAQLYIHRQDRQLVFLLHMYIF